MKRLLIIEDDRAMADGLSITLKSESIDVEKCYDITTAKKSIREKNYNLIILDIGLPDGSGLDLLQEIRRIYRIPVIMLTANDTETDVVMGLELGAADYITKPFSLAILRAKVNTELNKVESNKNMHYETDEFFFDFEKMEYYKGSTSIDLSKTEQRLLKLLIENRGFTVKREFLVDRLWTDGAEYVDENALSVTVKRLRNKLEDNSANHVHIKTVYGIGYRWQS